MKYLKFYESKENREVLRIIKSSFFEIYDKTMDFSRMTIDINRRVTDKYILSTTFNNAIDEKNHHIYSSLFQFLSTCDVTFRLSNNRIYIYINDLDDIANKLKEQVDILNTTNKFNI